jgi:hypothetical protein
MIKKEVFASDFVLVSNLNVSKRDDTVRAVWFLPADWYGDNSCLLLAVSLTTGHPSIRRRLLHTLVIDIVFILYPY